MEFNIIKRSPVWLQYNKEYTFEYQILGEPKRYKINMIYLSFYENNIKKSKFVFISGKSLYENIHFNESNKDCLKNRDDFINEISKWQKGGSYRKTHPIAHSRLDLLREEKKGLESRLKTLEFEINNEKIANKKERIKNYQSDLDIKSLNKFESDLTNIIDSNRYCISERYYNGDLLLLIYDLEKNKYRKIIKFYSDCVSFEEIPEKVYLDIISS